MSATTTTSNGGREVGQALRGRPAKMTAAGRAPKRSPRRIPRSLGVSAVSGNGPPCTILQSQGWLDGLGSHSPKPPPVDFEQLVNRRVRRQPSCVDADAHVVAPQRRAQLPMDRKVAHQADQRGHRERERQRDRGRAKPAAGAVGQPVVCEADRNLPRSGHSNTSQPKVVATGRSKPRPSALALHPRAGGSQVGGGVRSQGVPSLAWGAVRTLH